MKHSYLINPLAIKAASHLSSKRPDRWVLSGVLCEFHKTGVRYIATDGRCLGVITDATTAIPAEVEPITRLVLDSNEVAAVLKHFRATKTPVVGINWDDPKDDTSPIPVFVDGGAEGTSLFLAIRARYPNWKQILPRRSWVAKVSPEVSVDTEYAAQAGAFFRTMFDPKMKITESERLAECTLHGIAMNDKSEPGTWLATTERHLVGRLTAFAIVMGVRMAEGHAVRVLADKNLPFLA